ncbi:ABC transporter, permease protein [Filifactor alocis ATCC 35896]|uniref:ABC transporter, permease protein n=1 Tax=Filifactor alocis (strain ATCC 35896 / CCUG 47790 / D40 B5) TaxID=546269 RepID=D6GPU6_FILAD|nr:ABC transporter permease [Filifactor alocis]EFE28799.1 ABC transporter, permease protein [Filifactor alocis ATCC 35896]
MKNRKSVLAWPYVFWIILFTILPLLIIVLFSFTEKTEMGSISMVFTLDNYRKFFQPLYLNVLKRSVILAVVSTVMCLIVGYPMAYIMSRAPRKKRNLMATLFVLPLWTNFLLRTYAWMGLLREQGLVNEFLRAIGLIERPLQLLYNNGAVVMGMVYNFLPFMVLPIYSVLVKLDDSLLEAAHDLGANDVKVFQKVIFPLSLPGVATGIYMVFMPAVSTFVLSDLLGGSHTILLGNLIENQFRNARNWQFGSAISVIMLLFIIVTMGYFAKDGDHERGNGLW